jgi:tetratricopeptide (TPR) repeat protein
LLSNAHQEHALHNTQNSRRDLPFHDTLRVVYCALHWFVALKLEPIPIASPRLLLSLLLALLSSSHECLSLPLPDSSAEVAKPSIDKSAAVKLAVPPPADMPSTADSQQISKSSKIPSTRRDYLEMIKKSNEILLKDPKNAGAYIDLGYASRNLEQYQKDLDYCNKAIELDPNIPVAYGERALAYANLRLPEKALADLDRAIQLDPNNSAFFSNRGWVYLQQKQFKKSIEECTKSIAIYSDYSPAFYCRSRAYLITNQYEKAVADLSQAILLFPNEVADYYTDRALAYIHLQDYPKALSDLIVTMRLQPDDQLASLYRSIALIKSGAHKEALDDLDKMIVLNPRNVAALTNRSILYRLTRDFGKAMIDLDYASKLASDDATIYRERGLTYLAMNEKDKALKEFDRAIALNADDYDSALQRARIKASTSPQSISTANGSITFFVDKPSTSSPIEKEGFANTIQAVRHSKIADHLPAQINIKPYLQRDLDKYFQDSLSKAVRVDFEMLRELPTLGVNNHPVFFCWLKIYEGEELLEEGAVSVEAENKRGFTLSHFFSTAEIVANPSCLFEAFPYTIAVDVLYRAGVKSFELPPQNDQPPAVKAT